MLVIGTSWTGTPDQTSFQRDRVTSPCNLLTPLECRLRRSARMVILKGSFGSRRGLPDVERLADGMFNFFAELPKNFFIISRGKEALPAGTGAWVGDKLDAA